VLVAGAMAFNLVELTSERNFTPLLNDGSVHAQMVRAATAALRAGHLPLRTWYPYLGLGSPQFLHYQSLGAMLAGAAGIVVGPNRAFSLSLYLLVSLWPASVYAAARIFGCSRTQAAVAAACSPFLFSDQNFLAIGYEPAAYLWIGYGLWSQLWAMWTLPIAWAAGFRYTQTGRYRIVAILAIAATVCFHFMTGYLALAPVVIWVIVAQGGVRQRIRRGVTLLVGSVCLAAWVIVPVVVLGRWTSVNEFLQGTGSADSYGAHQVLAWLVTGNLFDSGRLPVITVFAGIGFVVACLRARTYVHYRAIVGVFLLSLILFFGRPTLGVLVDLIPGHEDLFLRRFLMGVQLSGLLLAGIGAVALVDVLRWAAHQPFPRFNPDRRIQAVLGGVALVALVVVLAPAWTETASYDQSDAIDIALQQSSALTSGAEMSVIVTQLDSLPPGRVFAGMPAPDWGGSFTVGEVPVFKYLSNLDFDMVGYTLRTASLMTDPEEYFDEDNVGDYSLFGIRYLVLPIGRAPVPRATLVLTSGPYRLWEIPTSGYVQVATTVGSITANRANIGARTEAFLASELPDEDIFRTIAFGGRQAAPDTASSAQSAPPDPGSVTSETDDLDSGEVSATVSVRTTAAVVLKVSFDPGWRVTVDGSPTRAYMVSPALVAVTVGPGMHTVDFSYDGYHWYPELFGLGLVVLLLLVIDTTRRRSTR
jgi:hypothetical protein